MSLIRTVGALLTWGGYLWLPGYVKDRLSLAKSIRNRKEELHIIFLFVDHFEPSRKEGVGGVQKVRKWCNRYEEIAQFHRDSDGVSPQHTWFYRYDYPNYECIDILSEYVYKDLGEIEFHLHHKYDTPESFTKKIRNGISWFNQVGAMISAEEEPQMRFGYIAGNWALDNGRRNDAFSGVNTELLILSEHGCYADFTFPAIRTNAQPRKVNSIYYAKDTPKPKSYNKGIDIEVGKAPSHDMVIFQGPLFVDWKRTFIEYGAFESFAPYFQKRIDYWKRAWIHVRGRPEWIFVKLHTHGMQSRDVVLGEQLNYMLTDLEREFKKPPFHLHYVTAREAYNIVKAAEAGMNGDPDDYRDFVIPQPANRKIFCNQPYKLERYSQDKIILKINCLSDDALIKFKGVPIKSITGGKVTRIELSYTTNSIKYLQIDGRGECTLNYKEFEKGKLQNIIKTFTIPFNINPRKSII